MDVYRTSRFLRTLNKFDSRIAEWDNKIGIYKLFMFCKNRRASV